MSSRGGYGGSAGSVRGQGRMMNQALQSMSVMSAMRTGNVVWDVMLAMSLPLLVTPVLGSAQHAASAAWSLGGAWIQRLFRGGRQERIISYKERRGNTALDSDTQNQVLIKAIFLYLHHLGAADFLDTSHVQLTNLEGSSQQATARGLLNRSATSGPSGRRGGGGGGGSYHSSSSSPSNEGSLSSALMPYKIVKRPPENVWYPIHGHLFGAGKGQDGAPVELNLNQEEYMESSSTYDDGGGGEIQQREMQRVFSLRVRSKTKAAVDDFIETAYHWYLAELRKQDVNARYYYELCHVGTTSTIRTTPATPNFDTDMGGRRRGMGGGGGNNNNNSNRLQYKRYLLSESKTFKSLFFPEKDTLLELVHHFQNKTGKYAIEGYPHKLGLLLHGPPGTGKTSLIKALAQYTGRSVVNVPLSRISTNAELFSIFFNQTYHLADDGSGVPVRLHFKDVIFVMEDVDAASGVVLRRQEQGSAPNQAAPTHMPPPVTPPNHHHNNNKDNNVAVTNTSLPNIAALPENTTQGPHLWSASSYPQQQPQQPTMYHPNNAVHNNELVVAEEIPDKLNLMGLLNVLDGVVDTPERIVVMTTNHPQMLDPALTRPGRIDKKLLLTFMEPDCMIQLLQHYFPSSATSRKRQREHEEPTTPLPISDSSDDDKDMEDDDDDDDKDDERSSAVLPENKRRKLVSKETTAKEDWVPRVMKVVTKDSSSRKPLRLTPAEIEQMAAEQDTMEGMIQALEDRRMQQQ